MSRTLLLKLRTVRDDGGGDDDNDGADAAITGKPLSLSRTKCIVATPASFALIFPPPLGNTKVNAVAVQMIYPLVRPCFNDIIWRCPDRLLWICKLGFDRLFAVIANILADTEIEVVIRRFVNSLSHSKSDSKTLGKLNLAKPTKS